ncbi:MAG TPA: NfeD family protein [Ktedonobacterales bacterium]|nr:NfeD family protein [Ktedonobacterales bacterium]
MLTDPTVLFILFIVAALGLYAEWAHPGAIAPGIVGAGALLLFLIGALTLPFNWIGFALMALGVVLLAAGVRAPAHGALTVGALVSLVVGSLLFFDSGAHSTSTGVNPIIIFSFAAALGVIAAIVLRFAIAAQRSGNRVTGKESYVGQTVIVIEALNPTGRVRLRGENWLARLDARYTQPDIRIVHQPAGVSSATSSTVTSPGLAVGAQARVVRVDGLTLIVEPTHI